MTNVDRVIEATKSVLAALQNSPPKGPLPAGLGDAWDEIEKRIGLAIKPHIEDASAAGKADGIRESEARLHSVFEAGKVEGRKEAQKLG